MFVQNSTFKCFRRAPKIYLVDIKKKEKKLVKIFENFFKIRPCLEKILDPPLPAGIYVVLEDCCRGQAEEYLVNGFLNKQMAPDDYMAKLTDYKNEDNKPLNYLSVKLYNDYRVL